MSKKPGTWRRWSANKSGPGSKPLPCNLSFFSLLQKRTVVHPNDYQMQCGIGCNGASDGQRDRPKAAIHLTSRGCDASFRKPVICRKRSISLSVKIGSVGRSVQSPKGHMPALIRVLVLTLKLPTEASCVEDLRLHGRGRTVRGTYSMPPIAGTPDEK